MSDTPYNHLNHAGNHGDVLKHVVLQATIKTQQAIHPEGIMLVDTHAGSGLYDLTEQRAAEYERGIMLIEQNSDDEDMTQPVREYLTTVKSVDSFMQMYPGSPVIGDRLLRKKLDEHRLCDLNVESVEGLQHKPKAEVVQADAFDPDPNAMAYFLPSNNKKHPVILIDPAYQDPEDFNRAKSLMERMLEVSCGATILLWYPQMHGSRYRYTYLKLLKEAVRKKVGRGYYCCTLTIDKVGMQGSGVFICNPTNDFDDYVNEDTLSFLSRVLLIEGKSEYALDQWMRKKPKV